LRRLFDLPVGYQDHSDAGSEAAFWLPAAALGVGVQILEKHLTHDRSMKGADHEAALNPDEFARFVRMVREVEVALGDPRPRPFSCCQKRNLVAARDLFSGEANRRCPRAPSLGSAGWAEMLVGRRLQGDRRHQRSLRRCR
jgi:sialic acid synthase SpsE